MSRPVAMDPPPQQRAGHDYDALSVPALVVVGGSTLSGAWTRGTPFEARAAFVPRPARPLRQLGINPAAEGVPQSRPHPHSHPLQAQPKPKPKPALPLPLPSPAASLPAAPGGVNWSTVSRERKRGGGGATAATPASSSTKAAASSHSSSAAASSSAVAPAQQRPASSSSSSSLSAAVLATRTQGPQRGLLALPPGTLPRPISAAPSATYPASAGPAASVAASASATAAPKEKASKPHKKGWTLSELIDLSSLRQLDAITAKRPVVATEHSKPPQQQPLQQPPSQTQRALQPGLLPHPPLPAWGATSVAWKPVTAAVSSSSSVASLASSSSLTSAASSAAAVAPVAGVLPPSALKSHRAASHKALSSSSSARSVAFASEDATAATAATSRPRSASHKPAHKKKEAPDASAVRPPPRRVKPTPLKKQLIRERLERFVRDSIVLPLIQSALLSIGDASALAAAAAADAPALPLTKQEREKQLSLLNKRIKKANYDAQQAVRKEEQAKKREEKAAKHEQLQRERGELKWVLKSSSTPAKPSDATSAPLLANSPDATVADPLALAASLEDAAPLVTASEPALDGPRAENDRDEEDTIATELTVEPGDGNDVDTDSNDDEKEEAEEEKGDGESKQPGDAADVDSDPVCEFLPAPAPPTASQDIGHLPSATPPSLPDAASLSSDSASSSSSSAAASSEPRLHMLRSNSIPASMVLSTHELALLRWYFQSEHHGIQPTLQGACRRHCKQMFKPNIDSLVFALLKELRRFFVRLRSRDARKASSKPLYVSGLKQTSKLLRVGGLVKAVVVAANIERNEAQGGLDDQLDEIMDRCEENHIPIVREHLEHWRWRATIFFSSILDYSGVGDDYKSLLSLVSSAQEEWSMLQEDSLLNPRPPGWEEELLRDREIVQAKKRARAQRTLEQESAYARAEAEKKAFQAAQASKKNANGKKKSAAAKKKAEAGGGGRELMPLPVLNEEDSKRGRRKKGRKGSRSTKDDATAASSSTSSSAASSSSSSSGSGGKAATTSSQLKGAGRALTAIAEAMTEDSKEAPKSAGAAGGKSNKKGAASTKESAPPAAVAPSADDSRSRKKGGGKSDKKGNKGKSHKG